MTKAIIGFGLFLALLMAFSTTMASGNRFRQGFVAGIATESIESIVKDLTPEQKGHIQSLQKGFLSEIAAIQRDLWSKKQEVHKLWSDPCAVPAEVKAKEVEIIELNSKLEEKVTDFQIRLEKALSPDQMESLKPFLGIQEGRRETQNKVSLGIEQGGSENQVER
jgi:hypothetical protein